ncbi:glycosyltransferase family 9 protein, partial [bacterium]|nr:glycosyltransferase family 9 protein [bacterium]
PWFTYKKEKTVSKIEILRLIKELRKNRYDLVVELHADVRNILIAFCVGKFCIGYGIRGFGFLLNKVANYNKNLQIIDKNLGVLSGLGVNLDDRELELDLSDKDMELANKSCDARTIVISPGAERVNKLWINKRWAELADRLVEEKYKIIFVGSKNEIGLINEIINLMKYKEAAINLVGMTNLKQLCWIIKKSFLLISSDAAPVHIAKALKTRSIALYGPTDPGIWGYDEGVNISIYKKLDCSFCNLGYCYLEEKYRCMKEIRVEDVYDAV